jgi:F420-non-reducing hydrogenase small subunit
VRDQGAKLLSMLSASTSAKKADDIRAALAGIPDPVGTFYRYGLPKSLLRRRVDLGCNGKEVR